MTWLTFFFHTSAVVYITANVVVLYYVFPAFQLTKHRAFVLIGSACLLGIFDTIYDHTVGMQPMPHADYVITRTLRHFTNFAATGLDVAGVVWLTQSFLRRFSAEPPPLPPNGA